MRGASTIYISNRGFTLIEMIMVIVLIGIVASLATPALVKGLGAFNATAASQSTLSKLRIATERMAREIREVRRDPANISQFQIATLGATTIAFTKTDGVAVTITRSGSAITVAYAGGSPAVTATLTDQVQLLDFKYYEIDGTTQTANKADIAYVGIQLQLVKDGGTFEQRTRVGLRNQV